MSGIVFGGGFGCLLEPKLRGFLNSSFPVVEIFEVLKEMLQ